MIRGGFGVRDQTTKWRGGAGVDFGGACRWGDQRRRRGRRRRRVAGRRVARVVGEGMTGWVGSGIVVFRVGEVYSWSGHCALQEAGS
jgi:hypothetical protein